MIRSRSLEDKMRRQRADAKTLDNLFRRRIEAGAKCSPFVSHAILQTAKEVFPLNPQHIDSQLGLGQVKLLVVAAHEPAGKALDDCQKVRVRLTLDAGQDDFEVRACRGVVGLRRVRLLRLASEAREQRGLLSRPGCPFPQCRPSVGLTAFDKGLVPFPKSCRRANGTFLDKIESSTLDNSPLHR